MRFTPFNHMNNLKLQLTGFFLIWAIFGFAQQKQAFVLQSLTITGTELVNGNTLTLADPNGVNGQSSCGSVYYKNLQNKVTLSIKPVALKKLGSSTNVTANLSLTYTSLTNTGGTQGSIKSPEQKKSLKATFNPSGSYNNKVVWNFQGGYKLDVALTSIVIPSGLTKEDVEIKIEIEGEKYQEGAFSEGTYALFLPTHENILSAEGNLLIKWNSLPCAESYDLEWTFISDRSETDGKKIARSLISLPPDLFMRNSSRVSLKNNSYAIPMVYESGFILYRVRAVSRGYYPKAAPAKDEVRYIYSHWSDQGPGLSYHMLDQYPQANVFENKDQNENLNWQSSITYAEEGKNKVAITYADGTLRTRQQTTRNNSENKAVIGETYYDYIGRPAVQVLPVPDASSNVNFRPGFNKSELDGTYSAKNIDKIGCAISADKLMPTTGAAYYYSDQNKLDILNRDYIPKANGYAFTQTIYTPDNTGRVSAQSGVGETYRILDGKDGHHTAYFYGSPLQEELDRLFGSEAGNALRYQKNVVVDPNKQFSVSYLDPAGKVVATALLGKPLDNLEDLPEGPSGKLKKINSELLGVKGDDESGNDLNGSKDAYKYSKTFVFAESTPIEVKYAVSTPSYETICEAVNYVKQPDDTYLSVPIQQIKTCYDCVLEYEFSLRNTQCPGEELLPSGTNSGIKGNQTQTCTTNDIPGQFDKVSTVTVLPGSYTLSKSLKVNEAKLKLHEEDYLKSLCLGSIDDFIREEVAKADLSSCDAGTCEDCRNKVGPIENYDGIDNTTKKETTKELKLSAAQYKELLSVCDPLCKDQYVCDALEMQMIADFSPNGQYGEIMSKSVSGSSASNFDEATGKITVSPVSGFYGKTDDQGFPSAVSETPQIDPSGHNLSIYNINNRLPRRPRNVLEDNGQEVYANRKPTWKKPLFYDAEKNVFKPHYYEENGDSIAYITVIKLPDNSYYPKLDAGAIVIPKDGVLKTEPQNLFDFQEFINKREASWMKSLVPYHPEYGYLEYCWLNNRTVNVIYESKPQLMSSNRFDQLWMEVETIAEAKKVGFVDDKGRPNPVSGENMKLKDPFWVYSDNSDIKNRMAYLLEHKYGSASSGLIEYPTPEDRPACTKSQNNPDMWTMANRIANCPDCSNPCASSVCPASAITTDAEWAAFRSLYYSTKKDLMREKATKFAMNHYSFNGCIGAKSSNGGWQWDNGYFYHEVNALENYWMLTTYNRAEVCNRYPYISRNLMVPENRISSENGTVNVENCIERDVFCIFGGRKTAKWCVGYSGSLKEFPLSARSVYSSTQACNNNDFSEYAEKKKVAVYSISETSIAGLGTLSKNCWEPITVNNKIEYVAITCAEDVKELNEDMASQAKQALYAECGQCPLAHSMQNFLSSLTKTKKITGTGIQLSCGTGTDSDIQFTPDLRAVIDNQSSPSVDIFWNAVSETAYSIGDIKFRKLTATITRAGGTPCDFELVMKIPAEKPLLEFKDLVEICCLVAIGNDTDPYPFNIKGTYFNDITNKAGVVNSNMKIRKEVDIQAKTSCYNIVKCLIPPKCVTSKEIGKLTDLLNSLTLRIPNDPGMIYAPYSVAQVYEKAPLLLTPTLGEELMVPQERQPLYLGTVQNLLNGQFNTSVNLNPEFDQNMAVGAKWTGQIIQNNLPTDYKSGFKGILEADVPDMEASATGPGTTLTPTQKRFIEVSLFSKDANFDFASIFSFGRLKVAQCTGTCNNFEIDVFVPSLTPGIPPRKVRLFGTANIPTGICKTVVAFEKISVIGN